MSIVSMIVGRCHVGDSDLSVVRYVMSRVKGGRAEFLRAPRKVRRAVIEEIIKSHHANQDLYRFVTSGGHGYTGRKPSGRKGGRS